jgi:hypothetical protein
MHALHYPAFPSSLTTPHKNKTISAHLGRGGDLGANKKLLERTFTRFEPNSLSSNQAIPHSDPLFAQGQHDHLLHTNNYKQVSHSVASFDPRYNQQPISNEKSNLNLFTKYLSERQWNGTTVRTSSELFLDSQPTISQDFNSSTSQKTQLPISIPLSMWDPSAQIQQSLSQLPSHLQQDKISQYQFFRHDYALHQNEISGRDFTAAGLSLLSMLPNSGVVGSFPIVYLVTLLLQCAKLGSQTSSELIAMIGGVPFTTPNALWKQLTDISDSVRHLTATYLQPKYCPPYKSHIYLLFGVQIRESFRKMLVVSKEEKLTLLGKERWRELYTLIPKDLQLPESICKSLIFTQPVHNLQLIQISHFKLPPWKYPFDIRKSYGIGNIMMQNVSPCRYFNDPTFGFIQPQSTCQTTIELQDAIFQELLTQKFRFKLQLVSVNYHLPKFQHWTYQDLTLPYQKLGLTQLFQNPQLPFITSDTTSTLGLQQLTMFQLTEGNMTQTPSTKTSEDSKVITKNPISFILVKPFYYYLLHLPTSTMVFLGKYK